MFDKVHLTAIGRAKTIIVGDEAAFVSEIVVRTSTDEKASRIDFRGPAKFKADTKQHLSSILLPIVDRIGDSLNVPKKNYEISVVNPGATASADIGVEITGFSADLTLLLAMLSATLQVPLSQDIVCTGHVASIEGDIAPVRGIPIKLEAVLATPGISVFVLPDLDIDRSLKKKTPFAYQAAKESLLRHKGDIKIHSIVDIHDAARIFMTDEAIVQGSLESGFFHAKATDRGLESPANRTIALFSEGNDKRFWVALESYLLNQSIQKAKQLLQIYGDFHLRNQLYPEKFGEQLYYLAMSLPPSTRKLGDLFPLVSVELYIRLTQYAKKSDYVDVQQLHKAVFGDGVGRPTNRIDKNREIKTHEDSLEDELLGSFIAELNNENLAEKVGRPLDEARSRYVTDTVIVKNGFEFNEAIAAFYAHIYRYLGSPTGYLKRSALSTEAIDIVKKAFEHKGGYKAALSEGVRGINGGMRFVFDVITEFLKREQKNKHINMVFKDIIDSSDWDTQVRLMEIFKERIGPILPANLRDMPTEQLAKHWEEIIRCYVDSLDKVSDLLKRL